jgi:hypothetical protein
MQDTRLRKDKKMLLNEYDLCNGCRGNTNVKNLDSNGYHIDKNACIEVLYGGIDQLIGQSMIAEERIAQLSERVEVLEKKLADACKAISSVEATAEMLNAVVGRMLDR